MKSNLSTEPLRPSLLDSDVFIDEDLAALFNCLSKASEHGLGQGSGRGTDNLTHVFKLSIHNVFDKHIKSIFENIDSIYLIETLNPETKQNRIYVNIEKVIMLMDVASDFGITELREKYLPRIYQIDDSFTE